MLIKAEQKYVRISPQKARLVIKAIKNFSPEEALVYLDFLNKKAAQPLAKVIKQALANAASQKLKKEDLEFASFEASPGPTLKRWRAVSRGRAHSILKRSCHLRVVLKSKEQKNQLKAGPPLAEKDKKETK